MDIKKIEKGVRLIIEGIGRFGRFGLKSTPSRCRNVWRDFSGISTDIELLAPGRREL
jgi:GTP cyclohydrolase I